MAAAKHNVTLGQGETWNLQFTLYASGSTTPMDLTSYTVRSSARVEYTDASASADFTIAYTDPINGVFTWGYAASESAALAADTYHYDIELVTGSVVTRIIEGNLTVSAEVTK